MTERYHLRGFGSMQRDAIRTGAYAAALERSVQPGSVVVDIGTGTGILALLAARLGAGRVYAIEPGNSIHLARAIAADNGLADRIEFIQGISTEVQLPERADLAVWDLRGVLPLFQRHLPAVVDARERLLKPGATLIPRRDVVWAAPVSAPGAYARIRAPWEEHAYGFDMRAGLRAVLNTWSRELMPPQALLADPCRWAELDYRTVSGPDVEGALTWTVARSDTAHGFLAWFDAELAEGVGFSTGPFTPETIYNSAFFPWPRALELREGDRVRVELKARLLVEDYLWVWDTEVTREGEPTEHFRQSTFLSEPHALARLHRRAHDSRPRLDQEGRIEQMVLGMMDGSATLGEIASVLQQRFPGRFGSWEEALTRAGRVSEGFAREE